MLSSYYFTVLNIYTLLVRVILPLQLPSIPSFGYYRKDVDIQDSLVGITVSLNRPVCPVVFIHDDVLPDPAINRMLVKFQVENTQSFPASFLILDLAPASLHYIFSVYNTTDPVEIILKFLHNLYRYSECYTFIIWIRDPKILELRSSITVHPGWRENDIVLLPTHHTTKLYKSLTNQKFWNDIPNIIALKRKYDGQVLASNEIRVYTVIPYYSKKRQRKSQELNVWLVHENRFVWNKPLFFDKFITFNGATLIVGVYWKEPFLIWGDAQMPYLDGLDWRLLGLCRKQLNFTLSIKHSLSYGRSHGENGSWTGMMDLLRSNQIDLGAGGVVMYSERMQAFDFTKTFFTDSFSFISPLSSTASSSWSSLIFQYEVWQVAALTTLMSSIALKVVAELEYKLHANLHAKEEVKLRHFRSFENVIRFITAVLCQRPYKHNPSHLSIQFVFYGVILGNFILGTVFSGCLIAYLFQFKNMPLADKLTDILNSGVQVNMQSYDGYLDYFMETTTDPTIAGIYKISKPVEWNSSKVNSKTSVDNVVRGKSIHIDSVARLKFTGKYRYKGSKGLKFHIGSENIIDHANIGWPLRKNWPFTKKFDDIINRAVENGFVQYWMQRLMQGEFGWDEEAWKIPKLLTGYLNKNQKRVNDIDPSLSSRQFVPLSTSHLSGVFYVYITGVFLASFVFTGEILFTFINCKGKYNACCDKKNTGRRSFKKPVVVKRTAGEKNEEMKPKPKMGHPKKKKNQSELTISEHFKIKKSKKQALADSKYPSIIWADFDQCYDRFGGGGGGVLLRTITK